MDRIIIVFASRALELIVNVALAYHFKWLILTLFY